jgi:hypothetical protein
MIDLTRLKDVVPTWNGVQYPGKIPDSIRTSVLASITRTNFKSDLLTADFYLFDKSSTPSRMAVDGGMEEGEIQDDLAPSEGCTRREKLGGIKGFSAARMGFGSSDLSQRQAASYNLYRIMRVWRSPYGVLPIGLESALKLLAPGKNPSVAEVDRAELLVAEQYLSAFSDFFRRPPTLPTTV